MVDLLIASLWVALIVLGVIALDSYTGIRESIQKAIA